ncbi:MAG: hypothetical protein Q7U98_08320 [Methylicorpusculum sp.]|uniref:hypothetical protein n=1 Tax=Methylicorpusculum sp. TaxID=2713644 RepID=UPI0027262640|nr:hypothetical protein [Methylicorpusculum sp.]MDO8939153.1 hypothetical protein [Methylicorpusculum sp.]MDP2201490.1 hypothetical protein [Methylicorpusculum sp.]
MSRMVPTPGGPSFGLLALIVGVAPVTIAGVQKQWLAFGFHILVTWIPAIHAGMTAMMCSQSLT